MTLLTAGLSALERGWSLCPINAGLSPQYDKRPHNRALSSTGHTNPITGRSSWLALQTQAPSPDTLKRWLRHHHVGLAVITGSVSGLVVLDFDGEAGVALMRALGVTPHARTPSGGYHARYPHPGWRVSTLASKNTDRLPPGLDIRADGGLAVLPPTTTGKGRYDALRDPFELNDPQDLPAALRRTIGFLPPETAPRPAVTVTGTATATEPGKRFPSDLILYRALERLSRGEGRNNTGYWLARALHNNGYTPDEIMRVGHQYVDHTGQDNTKGEREAYTLADYSASAQQAAKLDRQPWERKEQPSRGAQSATDLLQEQWPTLTPDRRARAAGILARFWLNREPIERTLTFLRLCGPCDDQTRQAVRDAYRQGQSLPDDGALRHLLSTP